MWKEMKHLASSVEYLPSIRLEWLSLASSCQRNQFFKSLGYLAEMAFAARYYIILPNGSRVFFFWKNVTP